MHSTILDIQSWNVLIQSFCWMLVHSLWQGLVLTVLCSLVILLTRKRSPSVRYNLMTGLFFSFLSACVFTFIYEYSSSSYLSTAETSYRQVAHHPLFNLYSPALLLTQFANYCSAYSGVIVTGWFIIFLFRFVLMARSIGYIRQIRSSNTSTPHSMWLGRVNILSAKLGIRRKIQFIESSIIKIPVVVGYFKPAIIIPLGLLTNLPADQVEAVLLHEMAHIRRSDYLVNFLQNIAENVFFFNPGLLWISALMKEEREHCCDDLALQHTGNKKQFLEALVSFKVHAANPSNYAVAFPGRKNQLVSRFKRIVTSENKSLVKSEKWFVIASLLLFGAFMATALTRTDQQKTEIKKIVAKIEARSFPTLAETKESQAVILNQKKATLHVKEKPVKKRSLATQRNIKKPVVVPEQKEVTAEREIVEEAATLQFKKDAEEASDKARADMKREMMRQQYDEKVVQKLQWGRQLIESKRTQTYLDAQRAYENKSDAEKDAERAEIQKSKALSAAASMRKTAAINAAISEQNSSNLQTMP